MKLTPAGKEKIDSMLGGEGMLDKARRAAARLKCDLNGGHKWMASGAKGGNTVIYCCSMCAITKEETL